MDKETLEKAQSIATILSSIAIPLLIAWAAHSFQAHESEAALKKDYVTLALGILTKSKSEQADVELRQWAVDIIDKNAPVRLPLGLREKLSAGDANFAAAYRRNAAKGYYKVIAGVEQAFAAAIDSRFGEKVKAKVAKGMDPRKAGEEAVSEIYKEEATKSTNDMLTELLDF